MLKSIFNHVLSPFFTTFLQKWHLNRKTHIFRKFSIVLSFRTRSRTFSVFILNSTCTIILCKYQKIGLFVNFLFHYW